MTHKYKGRPRRCDKNGLKIASIGRTVVVGFLATLAVSAQEPSPSPLGWDPHLTFAGNFDVGYHKTQFYEPDHNVLVGQWDSRAEYWVWPNRAVFAWGPYVRATGIASSKPPTLNYAWENAWLAEPGFGLQMYPFSLPALRNSSNKLAKILGPLRLFGEYNRLNYWGAENSWRPRKQTRYGAEHWRSLHVNDVKSAWWAETWNGLWWQSANEFDPRYRSVIFANAFRGGIRAPRAGTLAAITPYVAFESSLTGNTTYYWENRLLAGGGVRFAPSLTGRLGPLQRNARINRFALYAEYLHVAAYYRQSAPSSIPNYEVRVGITFSTGLWYY